MQNVPLEFCHRRIRYAQVLPQRFLLPKRFDDVTTTLYSILLLLPKRFERLNICVSFPFVFMLVTQNAKHTERVPPKESLKLLLRFRQSVRVHPRVYVIRTEYFHADQLF